MRMNDMNDLPPLRFPPYDFKISRDSEKYFIFDEVRRKYVVLSPEEWVRQHLLHYFFSAELPRALMAVEKEWLIYKLRKRTDIVIFNKVGVPVMLVECKSPYVKIASRESAQALRYNLLLQCPFLLISNGIQHLYYRHNKLGTSLIATDLMAPENLRRLLAL